MAGGTRPLDQPGTAVQLPEPGELLADKYRVGETIGRGGMGSVVEAEHTLLERPVAIKFLTRLAGEQDAVKRFIREARVARDLHSEHVVRVFDLGTTPDGIPYLVMERLDGSDLATILKRTGTLSTREAADLVIQACEGLAEAHAHGVVHRDLKPSNLIVCRRANGAPLVKVVDFGISKVSDQEDSETSLTASTTVLGSPRYMSPEQVRNARDVDERSDVWSLGVVLYRTVEGSNPFDSDTVSGLCAAIVADEPRPMVKAEPPLRDIVAACLEKRREHRLPSVAELAQRLTPLASSAGRASAERIRSLYAAPSSAAPVRGAERTVEDVGPESSTRTDAGDATLTAATVDRTSRAASAAEEPPASSGRTRLVAVAAVVLLGGVAWLALRNPPATSDAQPAAAPEQREQLARQKDEPPAEESPVAEPQPADEPQAPAVTPAVSAEVGAPDPPKKGSAAGEKARTPLATSESDLPRKSRQPRAAVETNRKAREPVPPAESPDESKPELDINGVPIVR